MDLLLIMLLALLLGLIPGAIASSKGRSFVGWWMFGALILIIALPASIIISTDHEVIKGRQLSSDQKKKCPFCAEVIQADAKICRFCRSTLPSTPDVSPDVSEPEIKATKEEQWRENYRHAVANNLLS